jgi:hypothetical protein
MASFGTLDGVAELFTSKQLPLAGRIHYLTFDLLVEIFIHNNAHKYKINHWLLLPVYPCTLLLARPDYCFTSSFDGLRHKSYEHGDLRIAHFFGCTRFSCSPFFGYYIARKTSSMVIFSIMYVIFVVVLLIQALNGIPLF